MRRFRCSLAALAIAVAASAAARGVHAQGITAGISQNTVYQLKEDVKGFKAVSRPSGIVSSREARTRELYAPAGSRFEIISSGGANAIVKFRKIQVASTYKPMNVSSSRQKKDEASKLRSARDIEPGMYFTDTVANENTVLIDVRYEISKDSLDETAYSQVGGSEWGFLAVPFKLYPGDFSVSAKSVTLSPYYANAWDSSIGRFMILGSAGLATGTTSQNNGAGGTSDTTNAGITFATGLIMQPGKGFQIGLIAGYDHYDKGANGALRGDRPWMAFQIGFTFTSK